MKRTVVVLLSDKRSGSTIFQEEICAHPQIQAVEYSTHRYLETQHWLKAATLLDMPRQTFYGGEIRNAFRNKKSARTQMIDTIRHNVPEYVVPQSDSDLVFGGWEALCAKFAQPVFFEKSPQHLAQWACVSLLLEWMDRTECEVKIIGLVRNPMSVQHSAYELFGTDSEVRQFGWADMYRNLLALESMLPAQSYLRVRYEDLVAEPNTLFQNVFDFIGVDEYPLSNSAVYPTSRNRWLDDPVFTLQLHESVKQIARQFGYTDEQMTNPEKSERSIFQKAVSMAVNAYRSNRHRLVERFIKPLLLWWKQR